MSEEKKPNIDKLLNDIFGKDAPETWSDFVKEGEGEQRKARKDMSFSAGADFEEGAHYAGADEGEHAETTKQGMMKAWGPEDLPEIIDNCSVMIHALGDFIGGFLALDKAHASGTPEKERQALVSAAQILCNKAAESMKKLTIVNVSVDCPDPKTKEMTVQVVMKNRKKDREKGNPDA